MGTLIDEIRNAIQELNPDDAIMLKWKMVKKFIEISEITKKNMEEARKAAQFIEEFEQFSNGTFNLVFGDPYCKKYSKIPNCDGCPIAEYGGGSCNEPSPEIAKRIVTIIGPAEPVVESNGKKYPAFLNPFSNLTTQLDFYLAYENEKDFLADHKEYQNWKDALISVIDKIADFLKRAIENKKGDL